jgi:hypothetical protein
MKGGAAPSWPRVSCAGKALCLRLDDQIAKPSDEKTTILIVTEYLTVFDAPAMIWCNAPGASIPACLGMYLA